MKLSSWRNPSITQRLRHMLPLHLRTAAEIGEGSGDTQHPMIAAGRELELLHRLRQQLAALGFGRSDLFQQFAVGLGIGADAGIGIALVLQAASRSHTGGDFA